ncbi:hypothetical protein SteCoe_25009 [Stentor coeruleus]|uniref:Uncharacterized protein n=1 Tax=Stentor coeruleus TaxID=5963 RepID=A0A1R2BG87_9CILI|nr:hypothetical protein SteCoe_25009 [Stentor coeruleus]
MSSFRQEKLPNIMTSFSPGKFLLPSNPLKSSFTNHHSQETEENQSEDLSNWDFSLDNEDSDKNSLKIISYEVISPTPYTKDKQSQTTLHQDFTQTNNNFQYLTTALSKLQSQCKSYEKQNQDLRKELNQASKELIENNKNTLITENQKLKNKLAMHENMILKVVEIAEELCGEEADLSKKFLKQGFHTYNYLISKLETARNNMSKSLLMIQKLKYEKASISEMLNCYIQGEKHANIKLKPSSSERTTPDMKNLTKIVSSKCTSEHLRNFIIDPVMKKYPKLMEMQENVEIYKTGEEENCYKRQNEINDISERGKSIMSSLKTIKPSTKQNNSMTRQRPGKSYSVSPTAPKPKKKNSKSSRKDSNKSFANRPQKSKPDTGESPLSISYISQNTSKSRLKSSSIDETKKKKPNKLYC